ncbi:ferrochelatase [Solemya pervernicosa gill symbiont]|uniref:Ferrochelatase n=2 Tax=Gammaproteobacteria incertae sedis TaxID=118884 RepID=A0A1T2LAZ7_9GAMM|nr:ferrochelatase [Candidatus Reidiella endopervernicosa]OOZ42279.1 ferrochelatase [Solemya pervernicosa gill symbiont]QKQ25675.1 ferrochelatase [Candidatus Reidiella endopervernicosa]
MKRNAQRIGILLSNLGTPDAPTPDALRRYLAEFLSDHRVIDLPRWKWWPILHGIILRVRPQKVAKAYADIWTDNGSPLLHTTNLQAKALQQQLDNHHPDTFEVIVGMRYGNPSIASALQQFHSSGIERIVVLPLYPQYSAATTASTFDAVSGELQQWRHIPALRFIDSYATHPGYINALAASVNKHLEQHGQSDKLLISFHGLPARYCEAGDPYDQQCKATATALAEALSLNSEQWQMSFQSRFGNEPWLQPYTDETLKAWGASEIDSVTAICPGFAADCLETVEEIAVENRDYFLGAGGKQFSYIPALNAEPAHIDALTDIVLQHSGGWIDDNLEQPR